MDRLDIYDIKPAGMDVYLRNYGHHFSKAMYEWAVSMMKDEFGGSVKPVSRDEFKALMTNNGIEIKSQGYDAEYVYTMAFTDHYHGSLPSEISLLMFVKEYLEDKDGYDTVAFDRFYADTIAKGIGIMWEDVI